MTNGLYAIRYRHEGFPAVTLPIWTNDSNHRLVAEAIAVALSQYWPGVPVEIYRGDQLIETFETEQEPHDPELGQTTTRRDA
jgi:hypothetical protein